MERHGRKDDTDRESRIRNSGITNDMQVYVDVDMRPAQLSGAAVSSSF